MKNKYNGVLDNDELKLRNKKIINTSIIGIIANFLLASFKALVGFLSGSIAIVLDSINNLSDVLSSVITIIGTKLAHKRPDREHPFGHGRVEYLSSLIISIIILYAGFTSFYESIKKILHPIVPDYSFFTIIVVVVAIFVKIFLGLYVKKRGRELNSGSLFNSGNDALLDSVISLSTLIAALIFIIFGISTEAYLGVIISLIIINSGFSMVKESTSSILGERVDIELIKAVKKTVVDFEEVDGVFDIIFNNYGPNSYMGSIHIEITNDYSIDEVDALLRNITSKVYLEHGVILTAIGIYVIDRKNTKVIKARKDILKVIKKYNTVIQMHGFYFNEKSKNIKFDIVVSFDENDYSSLYENIYNDVQELFPDYKIDIAVDNDFSVSI